MKDKQTSGFIVGSLLVVITIVSMLLVSVISTTIANYQSALGEQARMNAQFSADSGLDVGIHELNMDSDWSGTAAEVTLLNADIRTTYEVVVTDGAVDSRKIIRSTGRTYSPAAETTPKATRIYEIEVEAVTTGTGPSSVVTGVGGLILNNNSRITGGDVVVNGSVTVSNNSQIGLSTNPVNLRVAHQSCPQPVNATYPQVCTSGQPIINDGLIYADVQAQNQTNGARMFSPGLTSSTFAPIVVPGYNRPAHKAAVTATFAPSNSTVACGNNQTKTWPANSRITGNMTLGNNCTINIVGNVWVEGRINFGNGARFVVSNTVGAVRPVIMVDSSNGVFFGTGSMVTPNNVGTGVEFVTMWWNTNTATNGGFTCEGIADPLDCTNVTGLALSTSQTVTTIDFSNNSTAPNTVLRSIWSRVFIANNGALGAVSGQTIQLGNNAIINFTASIPGSDNIVVTWVKRGYLRVFQ
jgi:hypothetical protein